MRKEAQKPRRESCVIGYQQCQILYVGQGASRWRRAISFGSECVTGDLGKASFWEVAWVRAGLDWVQQYFHRGAECIWCTLGVGRGRVGETSCSRVCVFFETRGYLRCRNPHPQVFEFYSVGGGGGSFH